MDETTLKTPGDVRFDQCRSRESFWAASLSTGRLCTCSIICALSLMLLVSMANAQVSWKDYIAPVGMKSTTRGGEASLTTLTDNLVVDAARKEAIYVFMPYDSGPEGTYYPFMKEVRDLLRDGLHAAGLKVQPNSGAATVYLRTSFRVTGSYLQLKSELRPKTGGELLAVSQVRIPSHLLPNEWDRRPLSAVAYELAYKVCERAPGESLVIIPGDFSGGQKKDDGLVSDFSRHMMQLITGELGKLGHRILAVSQAESATQGAYVLKGQYQVLANDIAIYLDLTSTKVIAVTSRLKRDVVPAGMSLFPPNAQTAMTAVDDATASDAYKPDIKVRAWTNRLVYYAGDQLRVWIRPEKSCHVRVYYIQSDNVTIQIFPATPDESDFLKGGVTFCIQKDEIRQKLVINDRTIGQEFIKVFAARSPFDESDIDRKYLPGIGYVATKGYSSVTRSLGKRTYKGLTMETLLPVAEVKVEVKRGRRPK